MFRRRGLEAGNLVEGVVVERHKGTAQGGPLSPVLANVLRDNVDKALERRGLHFVRLADDRTYLVGWKAYCHLAETLSLFAAVDKWIHHDSR